MQLDPKHQQINRKKSQERRLSRSKSPMSYDVLHQKISIQSNKKPRCVGNQERERMS